MRIRKGIDNMPPIATSGHQPELTHRAQLLRDSRLFHLDSSGEVAHTELVLGQEPDDAKPGWIGQRLEQLSD